MQNNKQIQPNENITVTDGQVRSYKNNILRVIGFGKSIKKFKISAM